MEPTWFGDRFLYFDEDHRIEDYGPSGVFAHPNAPVQTHWCWEYMAEGKVAGQTRWVFSCEALALAMFEAEVEHDVFSVIEDIISLKDTSAVKSVGRQWYWIVVQLSLPLIELIGKLNSSNPAGRSGELFKRGLDKTFGSTWPDTRIPEVLHRGLRCGVLHNSFPEATDDYDIKVLPDTTGNPIHLRQQGRETCLEIRAQPFVQDVITQLRAEIGNLKVAPKTQGSAFMQLWQRRWGSLPV